MQDALRSVLWMPIQLKSRPLLRYTRTLVLPSNKCWHHLILNPNLVHHIGMRCLFFSSQHHQAPVYEWDSVSPDFIRDLLSAIGHVCNDLTWSRQWPK
ncbi:hypothetical protein PHYBLDRAFT_147122 [Phycomyces blakesleeanus NRRL 1555(-)]|uniref:Uncharacterized protein n=1 Tax=Phycomyces blakesleeanus (strain ATCC 8743b / DSM 1359 / FGSC 10004 / NBRC 33097 / NRRL 1555) TaxID=763407 RepID=A0A162N8Q3_PHYB8|nr:hypothetical protein PHYBLDRAFT_147122 [Phycomyces blakesleeanus NRRL 1555(-)]OAD72148.1 hypothetical protein PHYBLDRAFT_147122 [Phycomyces blakesleeanus NRRL 1555(-)]|eukprot:XP_018290188.1 hypothetical protein PHYBLDRAFT_147122 [Phycomyces blakesleeanus NRRL 1555(-)]